MPRIRNAVGAAFLAACLAAYSVTVSNVWMLGFGTKGSAGVVALHSGRLAFVYHAPSFLEPGPIVGTEHAVPTARNFLLPYARSGRRAVVSVPLYLPIIAVGGLAAWRWRKRDVPRRGFRIMTATEDRKSGG